MKKIVSLVLALALTLALTACGGGESGQSAYSTDQVQAMADAGAFSETLEELDGGHRLRPVQAGRLRPEPGGPDRLRRAALLRGHL